MSDQIATKPPERDMLGAFANALRKLARTKTFEQITVRAIVREAGFSSRTFYNHFKSKYDLVFWYYAFMDYAYLEDYAHVSFPEQVLRGLQRIDADRELFQGAFSDWVGPESLCKTFVRHSVTFIVDYIRRCHGAEAASAEAANLVRFYIEGVVCELATWCSTPKGASPEAFRDFLIEAMPAKLRNLLIKEKKIRKKGEAK